MSTVSSTRPSTLERARATLLAVAIGDALGQPVEMMTHEEVMAATGGAGVSTYVAPLANEPGSRHWRPAGSTTDDFQLTVSVARALGEAQGYDDVVMARHHVEAARATTSGWGGTTRDAVAELALWFETGGRHGRSPSTPASAMEGRGAGNGVAMKVSPLAVRAALDPGASQALDHDVERLALLTHNHPEARWCALVLARTLEELLRRSTPLTHAGAGAFLLARADELTEGSARSTRDALLRVHGLLGDPQALRTEVTPGFTAVTSVPYAIGLGLTFADDFEAAVLTAVNAGGDADSTASIAGALVAANLGMPAIPGRLVEDLPQHEEALALLDHLLR